MRPGLVAARIAANAEFVPLANGKDLAVGIDSRSRLASPTAVLTGGDDAGILIRCGSDFKDYRLRWKPPSTLPPEEAEKQQRPDSIRVGRFGYAKPCSPTASAAACI